MQVSYLIYNYMLLDAQQCRTIVEAVHDQNLHQKAALLTHVQVPLQFGSCGSVLGAWSVCIVTRAATMLLHAACRQCLLCWLIIHPVWTARCLVTMHCTMYKQTHSGSRPCNEHGSSASMLNACEYGGVALSILNANMCVLIDKHERAVDGVVSAATKPHRCTHCSSAAEAAGADGLAAA